MKQSLVKMGFALCFMLSTQMSHALLIQATYTDLNPQQLPQSIPTPGTGLTTLVDLQLTNNTGSDWTDFHFGVGSPIGNVFFGDLLGTVTGYTGPGTASFGASRAALDVVGLNVLNGGVYTSTVQLVFGEAPFALISGQPTIDGPIPMPVPGTLLLIGTGFIGLLRLRRKFQATA